MLVKTQKEKQEKVFCVKREKRDQHLYHPYGVTRDDSHYVHKRYIFVTSINSERTGVLHGNLSPPYKSNS